jgi:hypothetical protein
MAGSTGLEPATSGLTDRDADEPSMVSKWRNSFRGHGRGQARSNELLPQDGHPVVADDADDAIELERVGDIKAIRALPLVRSTKQMRPS